MGSMNNFEPDFQPSQSAAPEKPAASLPYKIIALIIVTAMLASLIFPALAMWSRDIPSNCHRGPLGPIHCHDEPIDHEHAIFT